MGISLGAATLITGIGSLLLSGAGLYLNEQQNQGIRAQSGRDMARADAKEESRYQTQLGITRQQMAFERAESRRGWQWKEEDRNWGRAREFATNFQNMVDKAPDLQSRLVNIWRQRGAV